MKKSNRITIALMACALSVGWLLCATEAAAGPVEATWNIEEVGVAFSGDQVDLGPYSKLSPWPRTDGRYLYSGCYDPAPLEPNVPGADRCFMTVDLKDHAKPQRLATVYAYDRVKSPSPPAGHVVWSSSYPFPNLPVLPIPDDCFVNWADPGIASGATPPACWNPGWNTHTHYVQEGPGQILAVNLERYRGGTSQQANYHGIRFYDISKPANPVLLSQWDAPVSDFNPTTKTWPDAGGAHHFNWSSRYLFLGTEYKGFIGKILVILDVRDPKHPVEAGKWWIPGQMTPGEDSIRDWAQQSSFSNPVIKGTKGSNAGKYTKHVGMHYVSIQGNQAYLSYHQAGLVILDVTNPRSPVFLSRLDYLNPNTTGSVDPLNPDNSFCLAAAQQYWGAPPRNETNVTQAACGNTHATKRVPGHGDNLLIISDEYFSCPYGHVRLVDITDAKNPQIISNFWTEQNMACNPANPSQILDTARFPRRGPSSHLGNAWGSDLYFMAWYGMGVRVIDLADPYHPVEVGFYEYEIDPNNPTYAGSDTYDVIFGPGNFLYISDGTSGLRVGKYTGHGGPK
jgi:hypothetical protein